VEKESVFIGPRTGKKAEAEKLATDEHGNKTHLSEPDALATVALIP